MRSDLCFLSHNFLWPGDSSICFILGPGNNFQSGFYHTCKVSRDTARYSSFMFISCPNKYMEISCLYIFHQDSLYIFIQHFDAFFFPVISLVHNCSINFIAYIFGTIFPLDFDFLQFFGATPLWVELLTMAACLSFYPSWTIIIQAYISAFFIFLIRIL